jgi:hypothetical protein
LIYQQSLADHQASSWWDQTYIQSLHNNRSSTNDMEAAKIALAWVTNEHDLHNTFASNHDRPIVMMTDNIRQPPNETVLMRPTQIN